MAHVQDLLRRFAKAVPGGAADPTQLTFEFERGAQDHESFKDWLKYGKPFEGDATIETDLPGGLGSGQLKRPRDDHAR